jgi:hypothetical protein
MEVGIYEGGEFI